MFDINIEAIPFTTVVSAGVALLLALRMVLGALKGLLEEVLLG